MPLWRIHPVARPGDPRWQGRKIWDEVVVRAPSAAMARVIACELDRPAVPHRMGNESLCFRSGLEDAKLYWVKLLGSLIDDGLGAGEPEGVVRAILRSPGADIPAAGHSNVTDTSAEKPHQCDAQLDRITNSGASFKA